MSTADGRIEMDLAHRTRLAVFWNTGIITLMSVGQFCVMLVLVRLLNPEVYGQYGLLMAIMGFLYVFSAQAFVDYTLQVRQESGLHYQEIFTLSVGVNFGLFLLTNIVAVCIRVFPDYADVAVPLHWLSLGFLLQPGRAVRIAMLKRDLDWKRIRTLHASGFVLGALVAIPLAVAGAGIYALIVTTFIVPLPFLYDIFYRCRWRPNWQWSLERLKPALKFGANRQLSGVIVTARRLLESGVVVQMMGFASLGVYGRAIGLAELACSRMLGHAIDAVYPSLTKIDPRTPRYRRVSGVVLRASAWFCIPLAALVGQLADVVVKLIYGDKWLEVVPLLGWAMAVAAAGAIYFALYKLLLAHEQQRHCLWTDVGLMAGTIASLFFLLPSGLISYLQGLLVTQIGLVVASAILLYRDGGVDARDLWDPFLGSAVGTLSASCVFFYDLAPEFPEALSVATQVILYMSVYVVVLRIFFARSLRDLVAYMPRRAFLHRALLYR